MLPQSHQKKYQELLTALLELQHYVAGKSSDFAILQKSFQKVQHLFQNQIMTLTSDGLDSCILLKWQSAQTEIHRALRLLEMDVMFFGVSRKADTSQQRIAAISDRINTLIGYCNVLLQL